MVSVGEKQESDRKTGRRTKRRSDRRASDRRSGGTDKRQHERVKVSKPVKIEASLQGRFVELTRLETSGTTIDLSDGGLLANVDESISPGMRCRIEFPSEDGRAPKTAWARVRRTTTARSGFVVALEFEGPVKEAEPVGAADTAGTESPDPEVPDDTDAVSGEAVEAPVDAEETAGPIRPESDQGGRRREDRRSERESRRQSETDERRKYDRVKMSQPVKLEATLRGRFTDLMRLETSGTTIDMSEGGFLAHVEESISPGMRCRIELEDEDSGTSTSLWGRVRRTTTDRSGFVVALEFDDPDAAAEMLGAADSGGNESATPEDPDGNGAASGEAVEAAVDAEAVEDAEETAEPDER